MRIQLLRGTNNKNENVSYMHQIIINKKHVAALFTLSQIFLYVKSNQLASSWKCRNVRGIFLPSFWGAHRHGIALMK